MAWAQNLLGFCFFACASQTPFSWVWPGGLQASKSYVAQRFALRFRMAWARFVIVVERWGIWRWRPSMGLLSLCAPVGTASPKAPRACFSWKLPATVTKALFFMGSKSNVSGFFRLQFRNGLGTKLAGVLLFRMRVPSTFFTGFVWWLAGFQVLRCAKVCLAWGNFFLCF